MSCQVSSPRDASAPPAGRDLLTQQAAAEHLGVTVRTLQRWRAAGLAPRHYRLGPRKLGYDPTDLVSWMVKQRSA